MLPERTLSHRTSAASPAPSLASLGSKGSGFRFSLLLQLMVARIVALAVDLPGSPASSRGLSPEAQFPPVAFVLGLCFALDLEWTQGAYSRLRQQSEDALKAVHNNAFERPCEG